MSVLYVLFWGGFPRWWWGGGIIIIIKRKGDDWLMYSDYCPNFGGYSYNISVIVLFSLLQMSIIVGNLLGWVVQKVIYSCSMGMTEKWHYKAELTDIRYPLSMDNRKRAIYSLRLNKWFGLKFPEGYWLWDIWIRLDSTMARMLFLYLE